MSGAQVCKLSLAARKVHQEPVQKNRLRGRHDGQSGKANSENERPFQNHSFLPQSRIASAGGAYFHIAM
jgi:hypothetical protein